MDDEDPLNLILWNLFHFCESWQQKMDVPSTGDPSYCGSKNYPGVATTIHFSAMRSRNLV